MNKTEWITKCQSWKEKWAFDKEYKISDLNFYKNLNLYSIIEEINKCSKEDDIFMCDAGSMSYICPVALKIKGIQRLISSPAQADMGWVLPASIGVALNTNRRVIVFVGDGSFMSNLQELAVVFQHNLNIKFILLNNNGYLSIRNTQTKFFEGRVFGTGCNDGLWFPDFSEIVHAFGLHYNLICNANELIELDFLLNDSCFDPEPQIIECLCKTMQEIIPTQALKEGKQCGLHDMYPFLNQDELEKEMIISL